MKVDPSSPMPHDAREIANFFLDYADGKGVPLTIMTLLKLIYFAHGWHLAKHGRPLVKNHFEAWSHGPVVRAVYESFPDVGRKPIRGRASRFMPLQARYELADYDLANDEIEFLSQIFDTYAKVNAFKLSSMTHETGSPWYQLWNTNTHLSQPGMRITNESICEHFLQRRKSDVTH